MRGFPLDKGTSNDLRIQKQCDSQEVFHFRKHRIDRKLGHAPMLMLTNRKVTVIVTRAAGHRFAEPKVARARAQRPIMLWIGGAKQTKTGTAQSFRKVQNKGVIGD